MFITLHCFKIKTHKFIRKFFFFISLDRYDIKNLAILRLNCCRWRWSSAIILYVSKLKTKSKQTNKISSFLIFLISYHYKYDENLWPHNHNTNGFDWDIKMDSKLLSKLVACPTLYESLSFSFCLQTDLQIIHVRGIITGFFPSVGFLCVRDCVPPVYLCFCICIKSTFVCIWNLRDLERRKKRLSHIIWCYRLKSSLWLRMQLLPNVLDALQNQVNFVKCK